jgi:cell division protein FtsI/penicillin-binding protein 2
MLIKPHLQQKQAPIKKPSSVGRISVWYGLLVLIFGVFTVRLFYLQVIRHDFYSKVALSGQLKQYEIPAERGVIRAQDGASTVPLVLNEKRYNIIADPKLIKDPLKTAELLAPAIGKSIEDVKNQLSNNSRYEILAKKLTKEQHEKVKALDLIGVFEDEVAVRTYPQGELAAQLLGFVNDENKGKYGIEQYLEDKLAGTPGRLKAITDQKGVPLLATGDNILEDPIEGEDVVLTIDVGMQRQLEDILKAGLEAAKSKSGSALILDANTGAVRAMANYPTYNPGEYAKVEDAALFLNGAVSSPLEVGSIMKPLTTAAALELGVINRNSSYYDPSRYQVDDAVVTNIEEDGGAGTKSIQDILQLSLNTGATWLLMQMGGGTINEQARVSWHNFMTNKYGFGSPTGIEQSNEDGGLVPSPTDGYGLNIRYANTTFGQGMTQTPLQMGAALAAVINGGTYYRPHLVEKTVTKEGKETPVDNTILRKNIVSEDVSKDIRELMQYVVQQNNRPAYREGYVVGGKTGTAELARPSGGGYYDDRFNGTYLGFVGGKTPQYVIVVRVNEPKIDGYAGARAAAPIFASLSNMLINNFNITPQQ